MDDHWTNQIATLLLNEVSQILFSTAPKGACFFALLRARLLLPACTFKASSQFTARFLLSFLSFAAPTPDYSAATAAARALGAT